MGNPFGRNTVIPLTNKSGGSVAAGDLVYIDTANNDAFTTGTTGAYTKGIGIAQQTIASNAVGLVLLEGYASLVNVNASVTRGNFLKSYTVVKQGTDAGSSRIAGTCGMFLTGGTTPDAIIWQPDLGAGSGLSDPMTTRGDIIVRNSSNVSARLAVGANLAALRSDGTDVGYAILPGTVIGFTAYNPTATDTTISSTSQADVDATNLIVTFTAPASGNILVRLDCEAYAETSTAKLRWGIRESSTDVIGPIEVLADATTGPELVLSRSFYLTGVSAGSHTYKWAASRANQNANMRYGGIYGQAIMTVVALA